MKRYKIDVFIILMGIILVVGSFGWSNYIPQLTLLALSSTFVVLVWYAYDTNRIANQTIESALRPIILRSGLNINWRFRSIKEDDSDQSTFLEIENLKNIAMDLKGHIILEKKQYNLLFGRESNDNKPEDKKRKLEFVDSYKWQWLPSNSKIFASFDKEKFTNISSENEIYLTYKDIEGNSYFTKEDFKFSQITGRL